MSSRLFSLEKLRDFNAQTQAMEYFYAADRLRLIVARFRKAKSLKINGAPTWMILRTICPWLGGQLDGTERPHFGRKPKSQIDP